MLNVCYLTLHTAHSSSMSFRFVILLLLFSSLFFLRHIVAGNIFVLFCYSFILFHWNRKWKKKMPTKCLLPMHACRWKSVKAKIEWSGLNMNTKSRAQCVFILNNYILIITGYVHVWSILMWSFRANKILWDSNLFVDLNNIRLLFLLLCMFSCLWVCMCFCIMWFAHYSFVLSTTVWFSVEFIQFLIQSICYCY